MRPGGRGPAPWRALLFGAVLLACLAGIAAGARGVTGAAAHAAQPAAGRLPAAALPEAAAAVAVAAPRQAAPQGPRRAGVLGCESCHGELEFLRQRAGTLAGAAQLFVPEHVVAASAHGGMSCADCHTGYARYPHDARTTRTDACVACHTEAAALWQRGTHGQADDQVSCVQCHGAHDIRRAETLRSPEGAHLANAPCLSCHQTEGLEPHTPHAEGVACAACHAPHDTRAVVDPDSRLAPARQAQTCGACHEEVAASWQHDIHGNVALRAEHLAGRAAAADVVVCTSCHIGHEMVAVDDPRFAVLSVERCAECHQHAAATFFGSYHGKATALGSLVSATCADCHGAHDILPDTMAASRVAPGNLVETCRSCHEYARPAFVLYDPHPDPFNRARNPWIFYSFWMMNGLLVFVLLVFGAHTLLWWLRLWLDQRRGILHGPGHGGQS
jgi:hypothetical protein